MVHSSTSSIHAPLDHIPTEVLCAQDYEQLAPHFIAADRLAYIAGGSGRDESVTRNTQVFSHYQIQPRLFAEQATIATASCLEGMQLHHPILFAPVAYQQLVHPRGELAIAQAAEATDSGMVASTLSSVSLEDIAQEAGEQRCFQLYLQPQWQATQALMARAEQAGYKAIMLTVDAAIQLPSMRALRAGFVLPEDNQAVNLKPEGKTPNSSGSVSERYFASAATLESISRVIMSSPLPVFVKGVLDPQQAVELQQLGAAGIVVSNHGGRTFDQAPAPLTMLPAIRAAVGSDFPLLLDSGIRSGSDVFKALALGADAVMVGRLATYALSVAGALGAAHMMKLLREEFEITMAMSGCSCLQEIQSGRLVSTAKGAIC